MNMKNLILLLLSALILEGCAVPLTDRRHFDPELEKREKELMIRKDFATGDEKRLIEKDLDRIHNNYIFSAPEDFIEMIPSGDATARTDKAINEKINKELERASKEAQELKTRTPQTPNTRLEPAR